MRTSRFVKIAVTVAVCLVARGGMVVHAADGDYDSRSACRSLPSYSALKAALIAARSKPNGGFNLDMWGTIVNRDGIVCAAGILREATGVCSGRGVA